MYLIMGIGPVIWMELRLLSYKGGYNIFFNNNF